MRYSDSWTCSHRKHSCGLFVGAKFSEISSRIGPLNRLISRRPSTSQRSRRMVALRDRLSTGNMFRRMELGANKRVGLTSNDDHPKDMEKS